MPGLGSLGLHNRFDGKPCPRREVVRCEEPGCGWINPAVYELAGIDTCHRCEEPITGTPVTDPEDPLGRQFCRDECLTAAAESSYEQHYRAR